MRMIDSGYGNSGDLMDARQVTLQKKPFRYIVTSTSGGTPGAIGGSFDFEIHGTNNMRDLLKPIVIQTDSEIIDVVTGQTLPKKQLAKQYLLSLTPEQRGALIDEMLEKYLTG